MTGTLVVDKSRRVYKALQLRNGVKYAFSTDGLEITKEVMKTGIKPGALSHYI
tara:strand:- start:207 stop:365 length:159 start_codon:yes stop_codon:yes gene_type:complete